MTQSGQGDGQELPAVRPAHEGVVLPAGGGEPWIPGGPADRSAPAGGQPWGQPWGPQAPQQDAPQQDASPQGRYGQYDQGQAYGQQGPPLPAEQPQPYAQPQPQQYTQPQTYAQPLPPEAAPGAGMGAGMGMGGDADATQFIAP
ncbi:hypothetical protein AB0I23_03300, partial [Streptomyces atratus]